MIENLNITVNGIQPQNCYSDLRAAKIGKTFVCCLFLLVSLAGNTLIAIIIYKTKTMRTTTNYFILNLAMSDLLLPILVFPLNLTEMHGGFWFFSSEQGQAFCKMMLFIYCFSSIVSIENLVLITVDRFRAVVFPLRPPLIGSKLSLFFILSTRVAAMALSSPSFYGVKSVEYTGKFQNCERLWRKTLIAHNYLHAIPFIFLAIAFTLIVFLYSIILFKLKLQKTPGEQTVNAVKQREKRERNVLRMAVAILTGFVLCWAPSNINAFLTVFISDNTKMLSCEIVTYWAIAIFMAYANCAVNP
ncbi:neuromedin-U receptor 2-like [Orbicella faveolata]|uniref:neuromedin-U receptor 2-like n=1 Tax=Orbicella faveolata TaxID=48498 RepID=UPI0009E4C313|nr:neuromedin-U receptor 2-like [Orbicella faveolata]